MSVETCVMDGQPHARLYLLEHLYYPVFEGFYGSCNSECLWDHALVPFIQHKNSIQSVLPLLRCESQLDAWMT